jgi:hypothetical protein
LPLGITTPVSGALPSIQNSSIQYLWFLYLDLRPRNPVFVKNRVSEKAVS